MWISVVILLVALFIFALSDAKKPKNFPKGPSWLPILGSALAVTKARNVTGMLVKGIRKIAEESKIADLIGFKVGKDRVVFVYSTEALLEMYGNQDIDGRPYGPFYETRTWNQRLGIVLTDGDFWITQRRFILRHMKEFGYGRKGMREICETEISHCAEDMKRIIDRSGRNGSVVIKLKNHFNVYVSNTLWQLMAGKRYDIDDPNMLTMQRILSELFASIDMKGATFSHFPLLRFIAPEMSGYKFFIDAHYNFHNFVGVEVDKHRQAFDPANEPQDLIDAYLQMIHMKAFGSNNNNEGEENVHESFSEKQLRAVILDLFLAGSETTNKSTNFMFLHLLKDVDMQDRARDEIDRVVGRNRLPTIDDRVNLPYCDAIVHEAFRVFMMFTCGIAHRSLRDTKLCGFDIPEDTMVIGMFNGMMSDKRMFAQPDRFDPEHFYKGGKLCVPENFYAFALGRHRCLGEALARTNSFLLLTNVVQNFILEVPENHTLPAHNDYVDGATPDVQDYFAMVKVRV